MAVVVAVNWTFDFERFNSNLSPDYLGWTKISEVSRTTTAAIVENRIDFGIFGW